MLTRELMPGSPRSTECAGSASSTGLGGSSLGGLVSLYLGLRHAEVFGKLAALSPSVWWNHRSILGYLNERAPQVWERPRLWLDVGDREGHRTLNDAELLNRRLKANGWVRARRCTSNACTAARTMRPVGRGGLGPCSHSCSLLSR